MMKFLNKREIFAWLVVGLWMGLIFFLSHQPATESSELSQGFTTMIMSVIESVLPVKIDLDLVHFLIRKGAHFFAYFVLGILTTFALRVRRNARVKHFVIAFVICVLYAISDEVHQLFIPGRSGEVRDVLIDSAGSAVGIICFHLMVKLRQSFSKKQIR